MSKKNETPNRIQAVWNIIGGEDRVDLLLAGKLRIVEVEEKKFICKQHFFKGAEVYGEEKIVEVEGNFSFYIQPKQEIIEKGTENKLIASCGLNEILSIKDFESCDSMFMDLQSVHRLLTSGNRLLRDGHCNVFLVKDARCKPWFVYLVKRFDGWVVMAQSVDFIPRGSRKNDQFFYYA